MNSTLSDTTNTTTITPLLANTNDGMSYSSLTIVIIVLCVVSGLVVAALCVFLCIKKRRTSSTLVENEKQHDETSDWRSWSFSPPLVIAATADSMGRQDNNTHKIKLASLPQSLVLPSKKKKVSISATARTMLDDISLPSSMTTPLSAPLPPPPPPLAATPTTLSRWKHDQQIEKRAPIAFEEGYDPKALLRTPYYLSRQHRPHPPSHHQPAQEHTHPLPCTMTNPPAPNGDSFSSSSVDDPFLLESLEREKHINDIYYRTTSVATSTSTATLYHHHRSSPSWGSSTIIQLPCITGKCTNSNNNSSLLSLSMAEKLEQDAELQRLSISSYHVW